MSCKTCSKLFGPSNPAIVCPKCGIPFCNSEICMGFTTSTETKETNIKRQKITVCSSCYKLITMSRNDVIPVDSKLSLRPSANVQEQRIVVDCNEIFAEPNFTPDSFTKVLSSALNIQKDMIVHNFTFNYNQTININGDSASAQKTIESIGCNVQQNMNINGNLNSFINTQLNSKSGLGPHFKIVTTFRLVNCGCPTNNFTGRNTFAEKIHNLMKICSSKTSWRDRIVVLHGLGGMGKSEVARMYANLYTNDPIIQNIAWIDSESSATLDESFGSLASELKLQVNNKSTEEIVSSIYQHFAEHVGKGLLIFDNAQSEIQMKKYFPNQYLQKYPLFLITSRSNQWEIRGENMLALDELNEEEALSFLLKALQITEIQEQNKSTMDSLRRLAQIFEGYPLGLRLAASNISTNGAEDISKQILEYIKRMEAPNDLFLEDNHSTNNNKLVLSNVWEKTFEKIKANGSLGDISTRFLNIMAYLSPDELTMKKVTEIYRSIFEDISEDKSSSCFRLLEKYSLISVQGKTNIKNENYFFIRIHRLVQNCTREKLQKENDDSYLLGICSFLEQDQEKGQEANLFQDMVYAHNCLKARNWPNGSIKYSIKFGSKLYNCNADQVKTILEDVSAHLGFN